MELFNHMTDLDHVQTLTTDMKELDNVQISLTIYMTDLDHVQISLTIYMTDLAISWQVTI